MLWRHEIPGLPAPLVAEVSDDDLVLHVPDGPPASFLVLWVPSLTRRSVGEILTRADEVAPRRIFVTYRQGSPDARDALREAEISFAGADDRLYVRAPGLFVDRDRSVRPQPAAAVGVEPADDAMRNPFAKRSSRIPRWLLLHHHQRFSLGEIAKAVNLNPSVVSRVVRALGDAAVVQDVDAQQSGRRRAIQLERSRGLLEMWLAPWQRRRIRQRRWDIGARDASEALDLLREIVDEQSNDFAIGGLAGAATVQRVVEPADVLLWTTAEHVQELAHALQPEPGFGGRGVLRVAVAPDPWTLGLVQMVDGLPVADPVQLWLDSASEGERALEAADAIAQAAGWS